MANQPEGFDLAEFSTATPKANYRKEPQPPVKKQKEPVLYSVKVDFKKQYISFNAPIMEQIGLSLNSLAHSVSEKTKQVALIVAPGNSGTFAKNLERGKSKGHAFKNRTLIEDLIKLGLTSGKYNLVKIGTGPAKIRKETVDNCDFYILQMYGEAVDLTKVTAEEPAAEQAPVEQPQVVNENVEF